MNPEDGSKSWTSQVESGQIDTPFSKILAFADAVHARVVLTSDDQWQHLDAAIGALPDSEDTLRRTLRAVIQEHHPALGGRASRGKLPAASSLSSSTARRAAG